MAPLELERFVKLETLVNELLDRVEKLEKEKSDEVSLLIDPMQVVKQLDATIIRERLEEHDRERAALLVLLRAALRKQRNDAPHPHKMKTECDK